MSNPIASLPDNKFLPAALHALADSWREAARRVSDLDRTIVESEARIKRVAAEDDERTKAAVISGAKLPADKAPALRAAIDDAARRTPHARAELHRLGTELATALHEPQHREFLAKAVRAELVPALDNYLATLDEAEAAISAARAKANSAYALLNVVAAVDGGHVIRLGGATIDAPFLRPARAAVAKLRAVAEATADTPGAVPAKRVVKLSADGRRVTLPRGMAAQMYGRGEIAEWLDGYPAEVPTRPLTSEGDALAFFNKTWGDRL